MMQKKWGLFLATVILLTGITALSAQDYYVAQNAKSASDTNPGTESQPFKTITKACETAQAGDTVSIKGGVYREALIPKNSGTKESPIVFQAYQKDWVMIKGSEVLTGLEKEGDTLWVKRPWTKQCFWDDSFRDISEAPYRDSARMEQIFINEEPMQWVPSRKDLKPGSFYWNGKPEGGELVIYPPEGSKDLNQALVEVPVLNNVLGAWLNDLPRGWAELRANRERLRRNNQPDPYPKTEFPEIHYIQVKGLHFRHSANTLNRPGVRLDGDYWLLENCTVEYMNTIGASTGGDYDVVRNCVVSHNGQSGLDSGPGTGNLFENIVTLYNNRKLFRIGWGGAGNKICVSSLTVRNLVSAFNYGSGLWFDIDCEKVLVEDCFAFGNQPVNAGFFYEISWDGVFRRNVSFANHGGGAFYGAGVVLSASASTLVEDNVIIGGSGGISLGGGRERGSNERQRKYPEKSLYKSADNLVRRNLVVEPYNFTASVRKSPLYDSTLPEANNRFLDNSFLVKYGASQVIFGPDSFDNPRVFDENTSGAKGNRYWTDLTQLDKQDLTRLGNAFKAVLNSLVLAEPKLALKLSRVELKDIWSLQGENKVVGYWLEGDGRYYLLLDMPAPGSFQLLNPGSGEPVVWDFPVLKNPVAKPLTKQGSIFSGQAEGPVVLVTGLGKEAKPISEIFNVSAVMNGAAVKSMVEGQSFQVTIQLKNPLPEPANFIVSGPGIDGKKQVKLAPAEKTSFTVPLTASAKMGLLVYQLNLDQAGVYKRTLNLQVVKPVVAPKIAEMVVKPEKEKESRLFGTGIKVDREFQRVKEIYDERTGKVWQGPEDLSGQINFAWNEKGLYLIARITDNQLTPNPNEPYAGDCLELFLDGRKKGIGEKTYTRGVYQVFFPAPDQKAKGWQELKWTSQTDKGITGRIRVVPNGYVLEAEISWTLFPELQPEPGVVIGLDVALDDADGTPYRTTQLIWRGTGNNFKDASGFGLLVLGNPVEIDFGRILQSGDIVTRDGGSRIAVYQLAAGRKPAKVIPLQVEGESAPHFSSGVCFDSAGNLYFLDGFHNLRLQMVPVGESRSRVIYEFPAPEDNLYYYACNLVSPGKGNLLVFLSDGNLVELATQNGEVIRRSVIFGGTHGGGLSLSSDGKLLAVTSGAPHATQNIALVTLADLKVVSALGDSSELVARPSYLTFIPAEKPFLAVVIDNALPAEGKESIRRHIVRIDCEPGTFRLTAPPLSNLGDGKSFSLISHSDPGGKAWLSAFDAITVDAKQKRVLVSCRTSRDGANIYAVALDNFIKGGLTLDNLEPFLSTSGGVKNIAIAP